MAGDGVDCTAVLARRERSSPAIEVGASASGALCRPTWGVGGRTEMRCVIEPDAMCWRW